ncbi:glutathionine S-transferase, partial [Acinetobacter baumannii ABNIH19]|uniref:glutathione binding-like protein n=1 Tax=Acinetobacter baumannii TaxID=470 RepID=UPI0002CB4C38
VASHDDELIVLASIDEKTVGQGRVVGIDANSGELGGIYVFPGNEGESDYDYLVNDNFGPADAYLFVLTNWSNSIEHDLTPYKHIIALRNKVAERQSVQIAMRDEGLIS